MRKNKEQTDMQVFCNCCGRLMKSHNGIVMEGVTSITVEWDYFSDKDGDVHKFDLCETCYDKMISEFMIPIEVVTKKEMI